jgi:hypothetical protein
MDHRTPAAADVACLWGKGPPQADDLSRPGNTEARVALSRVWCGVGGSVVLPPARLAWGRCDRGREGMWARAEGRGVARNEAAEASALGIAAK